MEYQLLNYSILLYPILFEVLVVLASNSAESSVMVLGLAMTAVLRQRKAGDGSPLLFWLLAFLCLCCDFIFLLNLYSFRPVFFP